MYYQKECSSEETFARCGFDLGADRARFGELAHRTREFMNETDPLQSDDEEFEEEVEEEA